ncbi:pantoate--beta-alanine ligase [Lentibacillus cibarius]|uniref:Pantothenate synthetase n=1 Tax=Lentibacillus cibarius TaxID=2583219 RepID=A0A549YJI1_9BACI|nr:pantoate--beta-alanine ligase [Lentibacillus cibarius]TRM12038.1 pantoate--beta-alanine ligase [Lentibacillus cibarius]
MKVIRSIPDMRQLMSDYRLQKKQIGFVPTMGYLHEGHLSLMREANKENDIVVASIFVNPLQFGPNEDYEEYPRDEQADARQAEEAGVDVLFIPTAAEMYPKPTLMQLGITDRADVLCGRSRPGHFEGVLTVLTKLFHIVSPHKVYFGLKDAQQVAVVDALIEDLNFPIELVGLPTVREADGLAKSSRNVNLTDQERNEAIWLYKGLQHGQQLIHRGEQHPDQVVRAVTEIMQQNLSGTIDYVELLSYPSLKPVTTINQQVILAAAVYFDKARLIDNLLLDQNGEIVARYD